MANARELERLAVFWLEQLLEPRELSSYASLGECATTGFEETR
jgi:hypothetical protein